jgi:hypothetical protein
MLLISNEIYVLNDTHGQQWYVLLLKFKRYLEWLAKENGTPKLLTYFLHCHWLDWGKA